MQPQVVLASSGQEWRRLLEQSAASRAGDDEVTTFRREIGLPTDRPVVMSGHQAQLWHPGILAKYFAGEALAALVDAASFAWLVVEQDANEPGLIRLPVRRAAGRQSGGRALRVETWALDAGAKSIAADTPAGGRPAIKPTSPPALEAGERWAAPHVEAGIAAIRSALIKHAGAESAAMQFGAAALDLLEPLSPTRPVLVRSMAIARTSLFARVLDRMRADAAACIRAYNAAVVEYPHERIQPLTEGELPLWVLEPATAGTLKRRRATVEDLTRSPAELAPRALLMTGLLRWAACDLFIHGLGGGGSQGDHAGYDRITERWFSAWLGEERTLAPSVVATATVRLNIDHQGPGPEELRRSQWLAHRARHEPRLLNDAAADEQKQVMVREIRALKRSGADPRPLYRRMHALLEQSRQTHAGRLVEFKLAAESAASRLGDAEIAADRTWAFPLYEPEQLVDLRTRIAGQIG